MMRTRDIEQKEFFAGVTPLRLYRALMDSDQHSAFTGQSALISPKVGGAFHVFDGYASGRNIKLEPPRLIMQTWRADDWPAGTESTVIYSMRALRGGTELTFRQTGVPSGFATSVAKGWHEFYWEPLRLFFGPPKEKKRTSGMR
ncbi:MAG: SRPBCC domain-containing protein [Candidatus Kerfeldbacteria bacterium]|nr:SRPBCC domain-containing protein [Candidatus Kerfeldbacteria bacterium]